MRQFRIATLIAMSIAAIVGSGCEAPGVGDPCVPETIPTGGFVAGENYIEVSSVQCRTRVCVVYDLEGDPSKIIGTDSCTGDMADCVTPSQIEESVFCSCRCGVPDDIQTSTTLCECPEGFQCQELLDARGSGAGVRGSYCVPTR